MNRKSLHRIWAVFLGFVLSVSVASCGGGGGSGSGAGSPAGATEVIQPIVSSGKVTLPPSVSPSNLTVVSGIDSQPVQADGSFSITLNKNNSQLVTAVNPESNPVLLGIIVNAQPGASVPLDMHSTAEALIYLSPGIAQDDTADAQTVMGYIKELPETTALANLLEAKIAVDPNILGSDIADPEINAALSNALQALIAKIQQEGGIQKSGVFKIIPTTPASASGVEFTYDTVTQSLEGRNYKKRYVAIWETNPEIKHLFSVSSISSIGMLTDSILNLQVTTYTRNTSALPNSNNELTLKVYGLGFSDVTNTADGMTSGDWVRLSLPAAETAVFDIAAPVIGTVLGINNLSGKASNAFTQYASTVSLVLQGSDLGVKLASGDLKGTVITLIKSSVFVLTENNYAVLRAILIECGADAIQQAAINSIFIWTRLIFSVANLSDVILSATSLTTTKLVETFTIIPSELAIGTPPSAPTSVSATAGNSQVTVRWNAVLNATSYNIYMASSSGVTKTNYNTLPDGMKHTGVANPYLQTGLTNGKTYRFVVTAVTASGESEESNEVSATPLPAPPLSPIAIGGLHACGLLSGGIVKCWGLNDSGQLGDGTTINRAMPVQVSGISNAVGIAAGWFGGYEHTCALLADGNVKCWGSNLYRQLGNGTTTDRFTPVSVTGISNAIAISAGGNQTCVVLTDRTVKCWGSSRTTPVSIPGIVSATALAVGNGHACAVLADRSVKCWGQNDRGQLGDGTTIGSVTPVAVSGITTATTITAGLLHTCAGLSDGSVKCWGWNSKGQLGIGTNTGPQTCGIYACSPTPVSVSGISSAVSVSAGFYHTCITLQNGTISCWGTGLLGDGSSVDSLVPVTVLGITTSQAVATGDGFSCGHLSGNTIKCWGSNPYGLGNGVTTSSDTPVVIA